MKWTEEQFQAIYKTGQNIIVSAGAGSGKTAVLTERILEKLKSGISLSELVVLTFTEAAAFEMKERVRNKIETEIQNGNTKLKEQLDLLDSAAICTFDSYSLSLVKKYHYLLHLDRNLHICDSVMISKEKQMLMDEVFLELFEEKNSLFLKFMDIFTLKDDQKMQVSALKMYDKLQILKDPNDFLEHYMDHFFQTDFYHQIVHDYENILKRELSTIFDQLDRLSYSVQGEILSTWYEKLVNLFSPLKQVSTYLEIKQALPLRLPSMTTSKKVSIEEKDILKPYYDQIKKSFSMIQSLCCYEDESAMILEYEKTKDSVAVMIEILKRFDQKVMQYKMECQAFEFHDITRFAVAILEQHPEILTEYQNNIKEIMVDEYQDTNDIGDYFISMLSHHNIYMVGDVKQSIYSFRNANPSIFMEKYDRYQKGIDGIKIDLMKNFRSRKEVLSSINHLFERWMDQEIGGVDYHNGHEMIFGNMSYEKDGKNDENHQLEILDYTDVDSGYRKEELEAFMIAYDIQNKIQNEYPIFDMKKNKMRPIQYQDITILMDRKTNFDLYKKIFTYMNIPLNLHKEESFVASDEILVLHHIFQILLCLKQRDYNSSSFRHHVMGFLRSFLFEYSDNEIFQLFFDAKEHQISFYQSWKMNDQFLIAREKMESLYQLSSSLTISQLLKEIYHTFSFYEKVMTKDDVRLTHAKLEYCMNLTRSLEEMGYQLEDFVSYFEFASHGKLDAQFKMNSTSQNAVQMMTIHKSKGLEFPVCYYSGLYKEFSKEDFKDRYLFHQTYGFVLPVFEEGIKDTILKTLVKEAYYQKDVSEKIRLFYVALTRAKEKMILVAPLQKRNVIEDDISVARKLKYRSFLDMLSSIGVFLRPYCRFISIEDMVCTHDYDGGKKISYETEFKEPFSYYVYPKETETTIESNRYSRPLQVSTMKELEMMRLGTLFHHYLEYMNFDDRQSFYLKHEVPFFVQEKLEQFFEVEFLKEIDPIHIEKEYEFIDQNRHGVIDLLIETVDSYLIIDYKLKQIDSESYDQQLNGYRSYLSSVTDKKIECYLYSILDGAYRKVEESNTKYLETKSEI